MARPVEQLAQEQLRETAPENLPDHPGQESLEHLVTVNIGPAHPAMHGTLRLKAQLDGEVIVNSRAEIGYLHRGFEIQCEHATYAQVIPYTDRLNYLSACMNNTGWCKAVEKLLDVEIPERAKYIRVIVDELSRIIDHLLSNGIAALDLGAMTNFWYAFWPREKVYDILVKLSGARLTNAYTRIGGVAYDLYDGFKDDLREAFKELDRGLGGMLRLLQRNRIFNDRVRNIGIVDKETALSYAWTGPLLRASGVPYDVRKDYPYYHYDEFDWDVVVGEKGDCWDRFFVRVEEIRQSMRIIEQAVERIPDGPIMIDDPRIALPPKQEVYNSIEGLINHFKLIFEGIRPPVGEIYSCTEAANGELGFHIWSDGTKNPYRVKVRAPSFMHFAAMEEMSQGHFIADAIAIIGSLNIIAGELDR